MGSFRFKKAKRGAFHTSVSTGGFTRSHFTFRGVENVYNNIVDAHNGSVDQMNAVCAREARALAREARRNARWRDRTGTTGRGRHARQSISGRVSEGAFSTLIIVKGGEGVYDIRKKGKRPYYHFLEAAMGKKYATIKPTVIRKTPEVIRKVGAAILRG